MARDGSLRESNWLRRLTYLPRMPAVQGGLWVVTLGGLAYLVGLTAWLGLVGLTFPYQLDYGEGFLLHFVKEWSLGRPIYKAAEGYPYIMANYPPLAILLALALTPVLTAGSSGGVSYAAGRLWTLVAILAIAALLVAWVRREGGRWLPAIVAALIFVGSPYIYHWAPLFRVDLIGLALTLGGLYAVRHGVRSLRSMAIPAAQLGFAHVQFRRPQGPPFSPDRREGGRGTRGTASLAVDRLQALACPQAGPAGRRAWFWLAVVLFVAGLYAKQSLFFAPAAALVYLFWCVNRRLAILMAGAMAVLGGGLFLLVNTLTHGGFWYGLIASNVNPFVWSQFWKQQADFCRTFAVLVLWAAWYTVDKFALERRSSLRQKVGPQDLYLLAALASVWLAGKAGAWENYYFEALIAFALCGGLGLARLMGRFADRPTQVVLPLLALAQVALMWHTPREADRYLRLTRESNEQMTPILAAMPDPIASEDMGLLVTNGKVLDFCSFQYSQLARAGRWNQAWELDQLGDRRFSMVILERGTRLDVDRTQRFTREFVSKLDRNYRHSRTLGKYELYEPDPLQREQRVEFGDQLALVGWSVHAPPDLLALPAGNPGKAGRAITLTTVWQAQRKLSQDYTAFAHLVDESGQGWAGDDHAPFDGLYPTSSWGAGEMVRDTFTLTVPANAPPGLYQVEVGWYPSAPLTAGEAPSQERLPVGSASAFVVAVLPVDWLGTRTQSMMPLDARFGKAITLQGYDWQAEAQTLQVTLRWSTGSYPDANYSVFVHLVPPQEGGDDQAVSQGDGPPLGGRWPTFLWPPGLVLDDLHSVHLPPDLSPGTYHLLVGLYDTRSGQRLRLPDGSDAVRLEIDLP